MILTGLCECCTALTDDLEPRDIETLRLHLCVECRDAYDMEVRASWRNVGRAMERYFRDTYEVWHNDA